MGNQVGIQHDRMTDEAALLSGPALAPWSSLGGTINAPYLRALIAAAKAAMCAAPGLPEAALVSRLADVLGAPHARMLLRLMVANGHARTVDAAKHAHLVSPLGDATTAANKNANAANKEGRKQGNAAGGDGAAQGEGAMQVDAPAVHPENEDVGAGKGVAEGAVVRGGTGRLVPTAGGVIPSLFVKRATVAALPVVSHYFCYTHNCLGDDLTGGRWDCLPEGLL